MKYTKLIVIVTILLMFSVSSCGLMDDAGSSNDNEQTQTTEVAGNNASVSSSSNTRQVATSSQGASIEGKVDSVVTENHTGISTLAFMVGIGLTALIVFLIGLLIPQPSIVKILWNGWSG